MTKPFMTVFLVVLLIAVANGQTAADLGNKYQHHEVYEVQPGVQLTPKFTSDGQVCEMQVEQTHFGQDGADLRAGLERAKIDAIIDQLVPAEERGKKTRSLEQCVGACQSVDEYLNVFVNIFSGGSTRLITIKWRYRNCD